MLTAREANFVFVQTRRKREDRGVGKRGLGSLLRPVVPVCASTRRARSHSLVRLGWRRLCQCLFLPSPTVDFELATCELVRLPLWSLRILLVDAHWLGRWPRVTPSVKVWTRPLVILSRIAQQSVVEGMDPTAYRVPRDVRGFELSRVIGSVWVMRDCGGDHRAGRSDASAGSLLAVDGRMSSTDTRLRWPQPRRRTRPAPQKMRGRGSWAYGAVDGDWTRGWAGGSRAGERRPFVGDSRPLRGRRGTRRGNQRDRWELIRLGGGRRRTVGAASRPRARAAGLAGEARGGRGREGHRGQEAAQGAGRGGGREVR